MTDSSILNKAPGWGRESDKKSDMLFGQAGNILVAQDGGINDDAYRICRRMVG
jgi:hypothetical protein